MYIMKDTLYTLCAALLMKEPNQPMENQIKSLYTMYISFIYILFSIYFWKLNEEKSKYCWIVKLFNIRDIFIFTKWVSVIYRDFFFNFVDFISDNINNTIMIIKCRLFLYRKASLDLENIFSCDDTKQYCSRRMAALSKVRGPSW